MIINTTITKKETVVKEIPNIYFCVSKNLWGNYYMAVEGKDVIRINSDTSDHAMIITSSVKALEEEIATGIEITEEEFMNVYHASLNILKRKITSIVNKLPA